jgi:hypothetical protein
MKHYTSDQDLLFSINIFITYSLTPCHYPLYVATAAIL